MSGGGEGWEWGVDDEDERERDEADGCGGCVGGDGDVRGDVRDDI